jgi:hypothetical protein
MIDNTLSLVRRRVSNDQMSTTLSLHQPLQQPCSNFKASFAEAQVFYLWKLFAHKESVVMRTLGLGLQMLIGSVYIFYFFFRNGILKCDGIKANGLKNGIIGHIGRCRDMIVYLERSEYTSKISPRFLLHARKTDLLTAIRFHGGSTVHTRCASCYPTPYPSYMFHALVPTFHAV